MTRPGESIGYHQLADTQPLDVELIDLERADVRNIDNKTLEHQTSDRQRADRESADGEDADACDPTANEPIAVFFAAKSARRRAPLGCFCSLVTPAFIFVISSLKLDLGSSLFFSKLIHGAPTAMSTCGSRKLAGR